MSVTQSIEFVTMRCLECGDDFLTRRREARELCSRCEKALRKQKKARELGLLSEQKQGDFQP